MSAAIEAFNVSKRYILSHQETEKYVALRDIITNTAKNLTHRIFAPSSWKASTNLKSEEFWALNDVSFRIEQGDRVGIIGRNGAGKSTLLKVLSRITDPTKGRITLSGRVASLLEVGTGFHPELTGRENIYLNGAILGMSKAEIKSKFDEIVAFAEVEKFLDTPVKRYSSGMYVRLAFAVASHLEPEILIVDEVLAVGDSQFQKKCMGKMEDVGKDGRTVIFVSHNMAAIRQLCSTGILLDKGRIRHVGSADECADAYSATGLERTSTILEHGVKKSPSVKIESVKVNGGSQDRVSLESKAQNLVIDIVGEVLNPTRVNVEARLHASPDHVIGIFSPSYLNGGTERLLSGPLHLQSIIELPKLIRGEYYLSITVYDPGVQSHWEFPLAVQLVAEGWPTETGLTFDQKMGVGSLMLTGETLYRRRTSGD